MDLGINGHTAVITGAARGIGRAIALRLAREGGRVCFADRDEAGAAEAAAEAMAQGGEAIALVCDVTDRASMAALFDGAAAAHGGLDIVFNNAGIAQTKPLLEIEDAEWHRMMDINAFGVLVGMQEAAKRMIAQGRGGKIVNTASVAGKQALPLCAHYCASKFAVVALTQAGARSWGGEGITVNAFCPGIVETDMWRQLDDEFRALPTTPAGTTLGDANPDFPLGRFAAPEDIVGLAVFLASSDSDYMTGQAIQVDGGMVMQ
ncbi:MAG: SDR family oxidoreductase [Rhodospirillaceae bacterium]|nr:SDR family oxidoreductase [Rhodospirillaceae bacterium]